MICYYNVSSHSSCHVYATEYMFSLLTVSYLKSLFHENAYTCCWEGKLCYTNCYRHHKNTSVLSIVTLPTNFTQLQYSMNSVMTVYTPKYVHQPYQAVVQIHRIFLLQSLVICLTKLKKHVCKFRHTLHFGHS